MKQISDEAVGKLVQYIQELPHKIAAPMLKFLSEELKDVKKEASDGENEPDKSS